MEESEWFKDEVFWEQFESALFPEERLQRTSEQVDRFIHLLELEEDDKILDLACGIGRHSLEFARRGYDVTALDITEEYLNKAEKKAEEEGLDIEFVQADMRGFEREETYDAVINFFTSFGYSKERSDNLKILRNVNSSLKPDGKFLLDVMGKEILRRVFTERDWRKLDEGYFLEERSFNEDTNMLESRWILIKDDGEVKDHVFLYKAYSARELERMLRKTGFTDIEIYGDLEKSRYDENANRLIALAGKR